MKIEIEVEVKAKIEGVSPETLSDLVLTSTRAAFDRVFATKKSAVTAATTKSAAAMKSAAATKEAAAATTIESATTMTTRSAATTKSAASEGFEAFIILTDDSEIKYENKRMRGIDAPTDVLSFPMLDLKRSNNSDRFPDEFDINPESGHIMLGDIIISLERATACALEFGHSFERELAFLAIHGMLHLCGYDHEDADEEELMLGMQKEILKEIGL